MTDLKISTPDCNVPYIFAEADKYYLKKVTMPMLESGTFDKGSYDWDAIDLSTATAVTTVSNKSSTETNLDRITFTFKDATGGTVADVFKVPTTAATGIAYALFCGDSESSAQFITFLWKDPA